jgi:hypothetical protein
MSPAPETNPANPEAKLAEGRDPSGRFAKGNPGGPGDPHPRRVAAFRKTLLSCITTEDIIAIVQAVVEEAKNGNMPAAKLILEYVLGKPGSPTDWESAGGLDMPTLGPLFSWPNAPARVTPPAPVENGSNGNPDESQAPPGPKANGSNGNSDESQPPSAPNANGSNGGTPITMGPPAPSGLGAKADQWLDRQMRLVAETLGKEPLIRGL